MRYEKLFKNNTFDTAWLNEFFHEYADIRDQLYNEFPDERGLCNDIFELIIQISDYILRKHNTIKERMREIMGGEILELYSERMARFEKEATARGMAKGISQVITNMLNLNMPFETISAATGYSHEQILDICKTLQTN